MRGGFGLTGGYHLRVSVAKDVIECAGRDKIDAFSGLS